MSVLSKSHIIEIRKTLKVARAKACNVVSLAMVEVYWIIGRRIMEEIQNGKQVIKIYQKQTCGIRSLDINISSKYKETKV